MEAMILVIFMYAWWLRNQQFKHPPARINGRVGRELGENNGKSSFKDKFKKAFGRFKECSFLPTYEYECQGPIGQYSEELQAMTDAKLTKCPKCHKNRLARLIGGGL